MGALAYTGLYQMTYLLLETAEGKLTNRTVNETFQTYLFELDAAITENDMFDLEPVRNSILEYYEATVESDEDIEQVVKKLEDTFRAWHFDYPAIVNLTKEVLKELI